MVYSTCLLSVQNRSEAIVRHLAQIGGADNITAIELPAAAVAVAVGFQELEWLLLAGMLAPLNVALSEAAAQLLGWPRGAPALAVCAAAAGYALWCLYMV